MIENGLENITRIQELLPTRDLAQFEERWHKKLDPDRKFEWTKEEEWIIFLKIRDFKRSEEDSSSE